MAALLHLPLASLLLLLPPTVAADSVSSHHAAGTASVTPAPCDGSDPSACPYYWRKPEDTFYRVFINGQESFVYIGEDPPKCTGGYNAQPGHCASHWNVQSQSYTMASAAFSADAPVEVRVLTGHGKLATKPFVDPRAVAGFGKGDPTEKSSSPGEYVFTVASAGHYSIELFGQGAGLRDALLLFLDDAGSGEPGAPECPAPVGGGKLYHFTGPNVSNPANPSWANSGYYAFDALTVGAGDVVCLQRGAWVEGHLVQDPELGCTGHNIVVAGGGVWSGQAIIGKTPADDRRALIQLCGANVTVTGITTVNSLAANIELSPYWYKGYRDVLPGKMQALRGGNRIDNVKALSTWWYSTDGLYAGPWGEVSNSFVMVNDDSLKPMARHTKVRDCTVWQGDNGWSVMLGWNTGTQETGMSVKNVHVIHVGHWADGYCYPCSSDQPSCHGGTTAAGAGRGYCSGKSTGYAGYRAVIGAIYGDPGGLSNVAMDNILVSGPYWRAFSIAATWSMFGKDPIGSIHDWAFGQDQPIVFEEPQKPGIKSKVWATGQGKTFDIAFSALSIANQSVSSANREQYFDVAGECTPEASAKTAFNITFG
jgi:hypothetical protein